MLPDHIVRSEFKVEPLALDRLPSGFDAVVVINRHRQFSGLTLDDLAKRMDKPLLFDLKNLFNRYEATAKGIRYFTL
jgi:UDP-N-acetyl-D-mannosaminuronate dehydrogenase